MKNKHGLMVLLLCLFAIGNSYAQMPDSVRMHVDCSLSVLRENSLYANRVDWKDVERYVMDGARTATTKAATFAALKTAFDALGDKHAVYYQYDDQYRIDKSALLSRFRIL